MSCQSFKNQIDEAALSAELNFHLESCGDCKSFKEERECLNALLARLECVNAPANFEFGVRAKLNSLPQASGSRVWTRRLIFASPAVAAIAVSAFALSNYNLFAPNDGNSPVVVQQNTFAAPATSLPIASPTAQVLAATNSTATIALPTFPKQTPAAVNPNEQTAQRTTANRQRKQNSRQIVESEIKGRDVTEPTRSRDEAVNPAPRIVQPEFKNGVSGQVNARDFLQFFGIEKLADDGTVESVAANSKAADKGIHVGDRIETINGQKLDSKNLNNSFRQINLGVNRNGIKRTVTMDTATNSPR